MYYGSNSMPHHNQTYYPNHHYSNQHQYIPTQNMMGHNPSSISPPHISHMNYNNNMMQYPNHNQHNHYQNYNNNSFNMHSGFNQHNQHAISVPSNNVPNNWTL